ncbi:MAG TPA: phosphoglucosamine mutase [Gammaproteobacteria bacterium]|nr:phosphoglucosamine mutase [Gammaproteobacteria bacterium]
MKTTRKYFGTDGIRGKVGVSPITAEFVLKLGWAAGRALAKEGEGKVLIGKDTRISGYMFESALEAGLSAAGMDIHLLGPMPTPAIAYLTRTQRASAGIVISASHNPYTDNGIKFFSAQGTKLPDELELAIEAELEKPMITVDSSKLGKAVRMDDAPGRYIEFCKSTIPTSVSLNKLKIVVDCANGATYHIAPHVFRELDADVIELGVEPDGFNINLNCGATDPSLLQKVVLAEKADVGIALDGDGDRVIMVDSKGDILDGDDLLYIIAKYYLSRNIELGGVAGTVMSNMGLELALQELGLSFSRAKVGDRHVIAELQKQGWLLGGEPSGHVVWLGATTTGDGIITALQILAAMITTKKTLHELKGNLKKFPQIIRNVNILPGHDPLKSDVVINAIKKAESELGKTGRILLRHSGTEPVLRIMVEGSDTKQVSSLAESLAKIVAHA